jgi:hypothetical protein
MSVEVPKKATEAPKKRKTHKYIHVLDPIYEDLLKLRALKSREVGIELTWSQLFTKVLKEYMDMAEISKVEKPDPGKRK